MSAAAHSTERRPRPARWAGNGVRARGRPVPEWVAARIEELLALGLTFAATARRLEDEGVPTAHGGRWRSSTVYQIAERRGVLLREPGVGPDVVELIARLREHKSLAATAATLNKEGIASPRRRRWSRSSVSVLERRARGSLSDAA